MAAATIERPEKAQYVRCECRCGIDAVRQCMPVTMKLSTNVVHRFHFIFELSDRLFTHRGRYKDICNLPTKALPGVSTAVLSCTVVCAARGGDHVGAGVWGHVVRQTHW